MEQNKVVIGFFVVDLEADQNNGKGKVICFRPAGNSNLSEATYNLDTGEIYELLANYEEGKEDLSKLRSIGSIQISETDKNNGLSVQLTEIKNLTVNHKLVDKYGSEYDISNVDDFQDDTAQSSPDASTLVVASANVADQTGFTDHSNTDDRGRIKSLEEDEAEQSGAEEAEIPGKEALSETTQEPAADGAEASDETAEISLADDIPALPDTAVQGTAEVSAQDTSDAEAVPAFSEDVTPDIILALMQGIGDNGGETALTIEHVTEALPKDGEDEAAVELSPDDPDGMGGAGGEGSFDEVSGEASEVSYDSDSSSDSDCSYDESSDSDNDSSSDSGSDSGSDSDSDSSSDEDSGSSEDDGE